MVNQITFKWLRCRDHYEIEDQNGFRVIQPRSDNLEPIHPLEINNALSRKLAATDGDEAKILEFANAFGMLAPFKLQIDAYDPLDLPSPQDAHNIKPDIEWAKFPPHEPEAVAEWIRTAKRLQHAMDAWDRGDLTEVSRTINALKMARLRLRLEPQSFQLPPLLTVAPSSLIDAIWVQLAHAVSNNSMQRPCKYCGTWFSYGHGTGFNSKRETCSKSCNNSFNHQRRKKESQT